MRGIWGVVGLAVAVVAVAAGALIVARGSAGTAVAELELGDCFDFPAIGESDQSVRVLEHVDVIDCDRPHHAEVLLVGELNAGDGVDYPNDADLFALVDQRCSEVTAMVSADFGVLPIAPTEDSWNRLSGRFQCLAVAYGSARTTGTLALSGSSG